MEIVCAIACMRGLNERQGLRKAPSIYVYTYIYVYLLYIYVEKPLSETWVSTCEPGRHSKECCGVVG